MTIKTATKVARKLATGDYGYGQDDRMPRPPEQILPHIDPELWPSPDDPPVGGTD